MQRKDEEESMLPEGTSGFILVLVDSSITLVSVGSEMSLHPLTSRCVRGFEEVRVCWH